MDTGNRGNSGIDERNNRRRSRRRQRRRRARNRALALIAAVVLLGAAGAAGIFFMGNDSGKGESLPAAEPSREVILETFPEG